MVHTHLGGSSSHTLLIGLWFLASSTSNVVLTSVRFISCLLAYGPALRAYTDMVLTLSNPLIIHGRALHTLLPCFIHSALSHTFPFGLIRGSHTRMWRHWVPPFGSWRTPFWGAPPPLLTRPPLGGTAFQTVHTDVKGAWHTLACRRASANR